MLKRLKQALVESFVGAIGLGYLLAQGILHFVNIFASPLTGWFTQNQYRGAMASAGIPTRPPLQYAVPELIRFVVLLAIWYVLLRWLYFKPRQTDPADSAPEPE